MKKNRAKIGGLGAHLEWKECGLVEGPHLECQEHAGFESELRTRTQETLYRLTHYNFNICKIKRKNERG